MSQPTSRPRRGLTLAALTLILVTTAATRAAAQETTWSASVQYSQGDYFFTETTRSWLLYSGFSWQGERFRVSVGLPVVIQDSRAITFVGDVPIPTGGPDSEAVGRKGSGDRVPMGGRRGSGSGAAATTAWPGQGTTPPPLALQTSGTAGDTVAAPAAYRAQVADPLVGVGLELIRPRGPFLGLDLTGSVKVPVRNIDSGVGTGELDVGIGLSTALGRGRALLFADAGWWSYGDPPGLELKDVVSWSVGVGGLLGSRTSGLVSLAGSSGIMEAVEAPLDVSALLSVGLNDRLSLSLGAGVGLSEASPDFTLSAGTRMSFGG